MDRLRDLTAKMIDTTTRERESRRATAAKIAVSRTVLFVIGGALDLLILYWAYARITEEIDLRTQAAQEAEEQKELLRVTLASIGDGVIVANLEARITFLNSIAERLTGWSLAESIGEPCAKIFEIVNESSRQRVQSPVEKVLSHGIVIGLANHTILIRKDRSEIPIDDSGAPIRDADGKLRGVVLVFRDFSAHKRSRNALHLAMENAQAANIAKDNFLAALSHELRTPLTPVVMTLDAWSSSAEPPANWQRDVEIMRRNLDLEARLIDDLLDLTRIVRGKLSLNFTIADANALLENIAGMYQSEIQSKKLTLSLDFQAANHFVQVDPARLQQVFLNILKNASKFTAEGGEIRVETREDAAKHLSISIRDTGIGMSEETLAKLFHPFEQGSDEHVKRYGGLGLGMAISKALIEAQGGKIQAESAGPGRGSTIIISLPTCEPDQASKIIGKRAPQASQRPLRILLLEDHEDTARALSRLLELWNHQVSTAHTVADALKSVEARDFDLILSDIGLPDGTGIEFIKKVRESRATPAVALTGFGMEDDVNECKLAGFSDHLTKPIDFQRLESVIQAICEVTH
jgi:PAS domain S-box-containing protein